MGKHCCVKNKGVYRYGRRLRYVRLQRVVNRLRQRPLNPYACFPVDVHANPFDNDTVTPQLGIGEVGRIEQYRLIDVKIEPRMSVMG